jgi:hypothetical protein
VVYEDVKGKRIWALKKLREEVDDDHMAGIAPGRLGKLSEAKGIHERKVIPDWMEGAT